MSASKPSTCPQGYVLQNQVTHARFLPVEATHSFTYPTVSMLLSVRALEEHSLDLVYGCLFGYGRVWGTITGLRPRGYLQPSHSRRTILDKLLHVLSSRGYDRGLFEDAWMMTMPSFFGFEGINPLTVYFCYKRSAELWVVVLEVHNTFGESHVYLLEIGKDEETTPTKGSVLFDHEWKAIPRMFHVSPFNDRSGHYTVSIKSPSHPPCSSISHPKNSPPRPCVRIHFHAALEPAPDTDQDQGHSLESCGPLKLTALLRPTSSSPLTTPNLLRTLCSMPFTLLLSMPRILYQAYILHYRKRLDVFIRPEPYPVNRTSVSGDDIPLEGGMKWQDEGLLEVYAKKRVCSYLGRRADETSITITLVSANPSILPVVLAPSFQKNNSEACGLCRHITIHFLSSRFYTICLMSPSAKHALLLGNKSEHLFMTSSAELFEELFSSHLVRGLTVSHIQPLSRLLRLSQHVRTQPLPPVLTSPGLSFSAVHPIDAHLTSSYSRCVNLAVICANLALEYLEMRLYQVVRARIVRGNEPWLKWERARRVFVEGRISTTEDSAACDSIPRTM
ncbi:hypothetical protein SERLA73DRAFT_47414 [Serpula lacrymans var. lacrymans S7.3]|uniref:DUF1365-domain-containing protein n=1 Tax=Serpula lacrymans var. lacrymans (strain S7.3) TaxID=936435 RepID=F8PMT3_SERL3|nr:hypothetical protein SERLA73DRAFT_47414 [Serpula lacrymans var. lacrymans S7.3]